MKILREYTLVQRILTMAALLMTPILGAGQAVYEAQRAPVTLTAGGSFSYFDADYAGNKATGIGAYADFSPIVFDHLGVEAEGRWLMFNASQSFREYNYLAGPRYRFSLAGYRGLHPYVKVLVGEGVIDFPYHLAYGRYFMIAPGGGVDIAINHRVRVRADYEYQIWPDAPGIPGLPSAAMKPNGVTAGVSYRIF
jgi:hypothetical protein